MHSQFFAYQDLNITASDLKRKALFWANQFKLVAFYESNNIPYKYGGFENILAVGNSSQNMVDSDQAFESLDQLIPENESLLCGIFSYDLKNQAEKLISQNPDYINFPLCYFFRPEIYFEFTYGGFTLYGEAKDSQILVNQILEFDGTDYLKINDLNIKHRVSKNQYISTIKAIQNNILEGDIYEMNYCLELFAENAVINPINTFLELNSKSPMPFAGIFKLEDKYLLSASPERFLKKSGSILITQPIKGTVRRGKNEAEDQELKEKLRTDEKEISENMMIMDLARNDLNKSCKTGSVNVEEMFGIYGFQQVFQMITTVTGQIRDNCSLAQAIQNAFPMGSMTGAPKIRAMQLIEEYEKTRRGLYSGSFGYIKPNGDFDFNVVIRSIQYNTQTGYLSFMVGSAITYDAVPENEYQECLLKAQAMIEVLKNHPNLAS